VIRIYFQRSDRLDRLHERFAVQLNDTHPALAVPELMRLLVDVHRLPWETAWEVTRQTFGYTNHTLMPEALERWSVPLFAELLPRHLEIVYAINHRFLEQVRQRFPFDDARVRRLSLIDESGERSVRMAHLACVGSHAINGVARLHTDLLERTVLRDFHALTPEKFNSKTNGVSPRRFLLLSNPELASLISGAIGDGWPRDLEALRGLESFAGDAGFVEAWRAVKRQRRALLARHVAAQLGVALDPDTLFDVQAKRIHEYKRQHLNLLRVVTLYNRIRHGLAGDAPPRTVILAGKAAPGYFLAKLIIRLAHGLAEVINADPAVAGRLKVVFVPQLNVKIAQKIYPAADLSEQISTAGTEASGTGNMKLALNGALTIGTLDGANVEIRQHVGEDNFFLFGLTAPEVADLRAGGYRPRAYYESDPELREALDQIRDGVFSPRERDLFRPLVDNLLDHDYFLVLADYRAYVDCQSRVEAAYRDADRWARMSILNVARMGYFSSDRAIAEYCREIWRVDPVPITLDGPFAPPAAPDRSAP
jgi:starch phosphorylase